MSSSIGAPGARRAGPDARQRGHDGEAGVLALGQVNRLRERLIGVRGAIDSDEDVVEHDALSIRSGRSLAMWARRPGLLVERYR